MKKEITVTIAALSFITSAVGVTAYTNNDDYICGTAGQTPLVMNFSEQFDEQYIANHKVESITFCVDCKTNLTDDRAYLTQGIVYYYSDSQSESRDFADLVCVDDADYALVQKQDSVCTEITVGTEERPLNLDIDKDVAIEWTWITPERLSMYEISITTDDGMNYVMAYDTDFYVVEITDFHEDSVIEYNSDADNEIYYPFGDNNFSITSTYNEGRDSCDHLAWDIIPLSGDGTVYAVSSGAVDFSGWESGTYWDEELQENVPYDSSQGFGKYVRVENTTSDKWFYYGHLGEIYVEEGQYVKAGTPIGKYSDTGYAFGKHLHLEIRDSGDYGNKLSPSDYFGIPDEYGEVNIIPDETELAIKCVSLNKHFEIGSNLGFSHALNCSDEGAVSGGILQWRGDNYRKLLNYIREQNTSEFDRIANKYGIKPNYLDKSVEWWQKHDIKENNNEYKFYVELFRTDWASSAEWDFAIEWEKDIINDAKSNGITDEKTILLFSRSYNYHSYGGSTKIMRDNSINDFESACEYARQDQYFLKVEETISLIENNTIEICSLESIRGENYES